MTDLLTSLPDLGTSITIVEIISRLVLAVFLAAIIGWEREMQGKAAGLRTHMMVCLGAAAFTLAAFEAAAAAAGPGGNPDPTRVMQGIVGGIGFLGAGQVLVTGGSVHGLTTAASIWVMGSIGIACGAGYYAIAVLTVVMAFIVLTAVNFVEARLIHRSPARRSRIQ